MATTVAALLGSAALAAVSDPPAQAPDQRWRPPADHESGNAGDHPGPPPPAIGARTCVAFEHENYGGRQLVAPDGVALEWVGRAWNDRISSVACAPGCRLIAYQTIVFGGARGNFGGARPALGPVWNDRISALRVACDGDQAAADPHH